MAARRPDGTDGSDHAFRETVDDAYKGAPVWRTAGWLLLHFTAIPTLFKVIWALIPYYTLGVTPQAVPFIMMTLYLAALVSWTLAKPASYKEHFGLIKFANVMMIVGAGMHFITLYKYHVVDIKQQHYSRRIWKYLSEEEGWTGDHWRASLDSLEAFLDGFALLFWGLTAWCIHNYILRKMGLINKLKNARDEKLLAQRVAAIRSKRAGRA